MQLLAHEIYSKVWIVYTDQIGRSDFIIWYTIFDSGEKVFLKETTHSRERRKNVLKEIMCLKIVIEKTWHDRVPGSFCYNEKTMSTTVAGN